MGRRKKAAKKIVQKKKHVVATQFKCLFCNSEGSVACKLSMANMIGQLHCRICDARFETQINTLSDPIDVFSEWLDEADELQEQHNQKMATSGQSRGRDEDDEDGVEMTEPANKRARTESSTDAAAGGAESHLPKVREVDPLAGLEVDSDEEQEGEKADAATAGGDDKGEGEKEDGGETWRDTDTASPAAAGAAADDTAADTAADADADAETWKDVRSPVPEPKETAAEG